MMRIAILSDIHGNAPALEAVLADIKKQGGADQYLVLGDLAALGPHPIQCLERLAALPNAHFVRGNTDRYIVSGARPFPHIEHAEKDTSLLPRLVEVNSSFAWTEGAVTTGGWREWLSALPLEFRTELPDGTRVLCVHAAPGEDDGPGIPPDMNYDEVKEQLAGCKADLVLLGHIHWPLLELQFGRVRILNPGAVSLPFAPDLRAEYALVIADSNGHVIEMHAVDYDRQAVIDDLENINHPGRDFIIRHLRGEIKPPFVTS